jgi:uncharacterized phage protein (TIGR01671 family)
MREIKFRAWDSEKSQMVYFPELGVMRDIDTGSRELMLGATDHLHGYEGIRYFLSEKFPLMQYTGFKDKNGAEIYEGDIVEAVEFKPSVVNFEPGTFRFCDLDARDAEAFEWEVIGNIHEHPELAGATAREVGDE